MTGIVAVILAFVLLVLAAIHILWALGYWWPIRDEPALARAVVGAPGISKMPGAVPSSVVAVALIWAACWHWVGPGLGPVINRLGLFALAGIFALRGMAPFLPAWQRALPEEPFRTNDRHLYGPLCLGLAVGFFILIGGAS